MSRKPKQPIKLFEQHPVQQRSPEWYALRAGRLTGSAAEAMWKTTLKSGGEPAARRDLRMKLALERLTNRSQEDGYVSPDMQWGMDHEAEALQAYEALTGNMVQKIGFLSHPTLMAGCSLDGYVGDYEIVVSIKCPKSTTHMGYIETGGMPADYLPQMLHELWITSAVEYHFVSYDPRFPERLRLFVLNNSRPEARVNDYIELAEGFLTEVDALVARLEGK